MIKVFILCTLASFVFAIAGVLMQPKYRQYWVSASYILLAIPPLHAIFDILMRLEEGNTAFVLQNYPMMGKRYICMLVLVTVIHLIRLDPRSYEKKK